MTVWVLYHGDIEDDRYIRGIFTTEALANEALRWDEDRGGSLRRSHHAYCCDVSAFEVQAQLPDIVHGPEAVYAADPGKPLFGPAVVAALEWTLVQRSFPLFDQMIRRKP